MRRPFFGSLLLILSLWNFNFGNLVNAQGEFDEVSNFGNSGGDDFLEWSQESGVDGPSTWATPRTIFDGRDFLRGKPIKLLSYIKLLANETFRDSISHSNNYIPLVERVIQDYSFANLNATNQYYTSRFISQVDSQFQEVFGPLEQMQDKVGPLLFSATHLLKHYMSNYFLNNFVKVSYEGGESRATFKFHVSLVNPQQTDNLDLMSSLLFYKFYRSCLPFDALWERKYKLSMYDHMIYLFHNLSIRMLRLYIEAANRKLAFSNANLSASICYDDDQPSMDIIRDYCRAGGLQLFIPFYREILSASKDRMEDPSRFVAEILEDSRRHQGTLAKPYIVFGKTVSRAKLATLFRANIYSMSVDVLGRDFENYINGARKRLPRPSPFVSYEAFKKSRNAKF